jgi:uncharacterized protein (DUF169 family)
VTTTHASNDLPTLFPSGGIAVEKTQAADFLYNNLRLKTLPVAVSFLAEAEQLPESARRPSKVMGKKITICQAMTIARVYGWSVGITKEDLICVPGMIAFGFTGAKQQPDVLGKLFCNVSFAKDKESGCAEAGTMSFLPSGAHKAMLLTPLAKATGEADTIAVYGNPAQVMRMIQAWAFATGTRVPGNFGGKVECTEYLIAPFATGMPRISIPGMGDRIFSMTQDDEMVFALPAGGLESLVLGLKEAGKKLGAKYPITFYQNFQPEFPPQYKEMADELKMF